MAQALAMAAVAASSSLKLVSGGLPDASPSSAPRVKPCCGRMTSSIPAEWGAVGLGATHQRLLLTSSRTESRRGVSSAAGYGGVLRVAGTPRDSAAAAHARAAELPLLREEEEESPSSPRLELHGYGDGDGDGGDGVEEGGGGSLNLLPATTKRLVFSAVAGGAASLLVVADAIAAQGQYGLLEGRSAALIHPIVMGLLFGTTLYAGYLGWQWRRVRTIQDEINALKAQLPTKSDDAPPSPLETQIQELTEVRKQLVKGGYRDRHNNIGSLLLGLGVTTSVGGAVNTYLRTGRLFPGPHLYAGAGITVLWALAASLVPAMQKGNTAARNAHILLNAINIILFVWQLPTGIEIVYKVFEFTKWP